ncbi:hypothetical protein [Streptomyces mirabilis]|uniref:Uncharacterized protein n=1 Tax=Streptomyces mirabilis TaxID=68239 RepID=A0ABU3V7F3_9ACTN|nr:hypothetical protein [Streptomyces mirabilis]MCX4617539.1 hypothetical protein [Streptomyces mirabilis]MDU9002102.1 hypothetical protein [Streptomyces mirabilis]
MVFAFDRGPARSAGQLTVARRGTGRGREPLSSVRRLLCQPSERDLTTSARLRDTVIASVSTDPPASSGSDLASRALALDAALETALTTGPPAAGAGVPLRDTETALLREWLQRPTG